jgi:hypothetical protein
MHDHETLALIGLADLRDGGGHDRRSVDRNIAAEIPVELEFQLFFDRQRMEAPALLPHRRHALFGYAMAGEIEKAGSLEIVAKDCDRVDEGCFPSAPRAREIKDRDAIEIGYGSQAATLRHAQLNTWLLQIASSEHSQANSPKSSGAQKRRY